MKRYDDIINLSRPRSPKHPPMSRAARAAQFASFRALTGFEDSTSEQARLTDQRQELSEEQARALNAALADLASQITERPAVSLTYFVPDGKKQGGSYQTLMGTARQISLPENFLKLADGTTVSLTDILYLQTAPRAEK